MNSQTQLPCPGEKPEFKWIPLKQLYIDHTYQRTTQARRGQNNIEQIRQNFTWRDCGVLVVAWDKSLKRFHVIDGQHRVEAVTRRGDIAEMPCFVIKEAGSKEQAKGFVAINKHRHALHNLANFHAEVVAEDPIAVKVFNFLKECNIAVPHSQQQEGKCAPDELQCIGTIKSLLSSHKKEHIKWAFDTIAAAWPHKNGRNREMIIKLLSNFVRANPDADRNITVKTLREINPRLFEEEARSVARMQGGHTLFVMVNAFGKQYRKAGGECREIALTKNHVSPKPITNLPREKAPPPPIQPLQAPDITTQVLTLKKKGKTLAHIQLELKPCSNSERKIISDIFYGKAQSE